MIVHRRPRAFLLPLALVFLFVLLMLEIGMIQLQQIAEENALNEKERLALLIGTEEVYANLGTALETGQPSGPVNLSDSTLTYDLPKSDLVLTANWANDTSVNEPLPTDWSTYDNIQKRDPGVPEFSFYSEDESQAGKNKLPLGHTRLELDNSAHDFSSVASFSHMFPFGIYAPGGSITADSISSFTNPIIYESDDVINEESGRPVDICAQNNIAVSDYYSSGRAFSESGTVRLPEGDNSPGAIGFSGHPNPPNLWNGLATNLATLGNNISLGALDKTEFLDDQVFTWDHLSDIFSGEVDELLTIFGVGQACKVPFFPVPATQDDVLLFVFYLHHPWPVDFSGVARNGDDSKKLVELQKKLKEKQEELTKKQAELATEEAKSKPDQDTIDKLNGEISDLNSDITTLKAAQKKLTDKMNEDSKDINKQLTQGKVPETAVEDAEQVTTGWSYIRIISDLLSLAWDLIRGKSIADDLVTPTRVVHLGGTNPDWDWEDDTIDMKANLTVPPGRTLQITKSNVKVRGDVYLQRGSLLYIDGSLAVERPSTWDDFKGVEASDFGGYPLGRVIIEEGASLVVKNDLTVSGGNYYEGSVMVTSAYGPSKAMTRLIQAGGNIDFKYGVAPVVTLGDLVDELGKDNDNLKGFNDEFFTPLIEDVFPLVGKLPYVGAWQWRKCWFAKYATTFEFIPELEEFGLGGPWPIPLPFPNCLRPVFKWISIMYACELNAFIGENLYTQSTFWFFGRGVTPVILKVYPDLVADDLNSLSWGKITVDSLKEEAGNFLKDDMPKFAANVVQNLIVKIVESWISDLIPFDPPTCGSSSDDDSGDDDSGDDDDNDDEDAGPADAIKEFAKEFLKDVLKEFGGIVLRSFQKTLLTMKNEVYNKLDSGDGEYSIKRQVPGVAVYSGGEITISDNAMMAMGLFLAQGDVNIGANETIGTVISVAGNVTVNKLLHYPYFERVSVYEPKPGVSIWENVATVIPPEGSNAGFVGDTWAKRLAEGWK
jgi:hypothetical protein